MPCSPASRAHSVVWASLFLLAAPTFAAPIHVSTAGSDAAPGTAAAPVRTIARAIQLAAPAADPIHVAEGLYVETVELATGTRLYGGFVPGQGWTRDPVAHPSILSGGTQAVIGNADSDIVLDGLVIRSANAGPGGTSIGMFLTSCQDVSVVACRVEAGNGGAGSAGEAGANGGTGGNGQQGTPGCENATPFCSTCSKPQGGPGGTSPWGSGGGKGGNAGLADSSGSPGAIGAGSSPGGGGGGVPSRHTGSLLPYVGQAGGQGAHGIHGAGGSAIGTIGASGYTPAAGQLGTHGSHGSGGGGGGGGGGGTLACDSYGSSGGGGGAGGERGGRGGVGGGGGGSFGIVLHACSGVAVRGCTLVTGTGGTGGAGGAGGAGGNGGSAGPAGLYGGSDEQDDAPNGAPGGIGGKGGNGGAGGGGGGGPTIALYNSGPDPVGVANNVYTPGTPGSGGGGPSPGQTGASMTVSGPTGVLAVNDATPAPTLALTGAPNPFRTRTRLEWTLPAESRVTLTVHDLHGARIATVAAGVFAAGPHAVEWDGTTPSGRRAPVGLYFARLVVGGTRSETRMLKVVVAR